MSAELILDLVAGLAQIGSQIEDSPLYAVVARLLGLLRTAWGATGQDPAHFDEMVAKWRVEIEVEIDQDKAIEDALARGPSA